MAVWALKISMRRELGKGFPKLASAPRSNGSGSYGSDTKPDMLLSGYILFLFLLSSSAALGLTMSSGPQRVAAVRTFVAAPTLCVVLPMCLVLSERRRAAAKARRVLQEWRARMEELTGLPKLAWKKRSRAKISPA